MPICEDNQIEGNHAIGGEWPNGFIFRSCPPPTLRGDLLDSREDAAYSSVLGGGIYMDRSVYTAYAHVHLANNTIIDNESVTHPSCAVGGGVACTLGGGLYAGKVAGDITANTFSGNHTTVDYACDTVVTQFSARGGGMAVSMYGVTCDENTIADNEAAVLVADPNTPKEGDVLTARGGGAFAGAGTAVLTWTHNVTCGNFALVENSGDARAAALGGGICSEQGAAFERSTISDNRVEVSSGTSEARNVEAHGAGVCSEDGAFDSCKITDNEAHVDCPSEPNNDGYFRYPDLPTAIAVCGGGIADAYGARIHSCIVARNAVSAMNQTGGTFKVLGGGVGMGYYYEVKNCTITGNTAVTNVNGQSYGGGIGLCEFLWYDYQIYNNIIWDNHADRGWILAVLGNCGVVEMRHNDTDDYSDPNSVYVAWDELRDAIFWLDLRQHCIRPVLCLAGRELPHCGELALSRHG